MLGWWGWLGGRIRRAWNSERGLRKTRTVTEGGWWKRMAVPPLQMVGQFLGVTGLEHRIGGEGEICSLFSYCGGSLLVGRGQEGGFNWV